MRPLFQGVDGQLLTVSSDGGRGEEALWGLFCRDMNPNCEGSTLMCLYHLSKARRLIPSHWGGGGGQDFNI